MRNLLRFTLREDEITVDEAAPKEARTAHKSLEDLLKLGDLPESVKSTVSAARRELAKRIAVWDDLRRPEASTEAMAETFEGIKLSEAAEGEYHVKIISPGWGSSGYYSESTLKKAADNKVFAAGTHQYINHPTKTEERDRPERDVHSLAAVLSEDARYEAKGKDGPGLYARMKVFGHWQPVIKELAPHIGLSIRGEGEGHIGEAEGRKGRIIENIVSGKSVDFVTKAGRDGKLLPLFESAWNHSEDDSMDLKEAQEENARLKAENATLAEASAKDKADAARLRTAMLLTEARRVALEALKDDTKVPVAVRERIVEAAVHNAKAKDDGTLDADALKTAVSEARKSEIAYLASIGLVPNGQVTGMGDGGAASTGNVEEGAKRLGNAIGTAFGLTETATKIAVNGR